MSEKRYIREPDHDEHFARDDDPAADGWIDTEASKIEFVVPTWTGRDRATVFDKFRILGGLISLLLSFISSGEDRI